MQLETKLLLRPSEKKALRHFLNFPELDAMKLASLEDIATSRASDYLNSLERYGYLRHRREGHRVFYYLKPDIAEQVKNALAGEVLSQKEIEESFQKALKWLLQVRNSDGGWGDHKDDASNITNTAEVLLALSILGHPKASREIREGIRFIKKNVHELDRARDVAWTGLAFLRIDGVDAKEIDWILSSLSDHQHDEGYWEEKSTYSTAIALEFLSHFPDRGHLMIDKAKKWLLSNFDEKGWGLKPGEEIDLAVTAHAVYSLILIDGKDPEVRSLFNSSRRFLLNETKRWTSVSEDILIRDNAMFFRLFPLACILYVLLAIGENPALKYISENILKLIKLQTKEGGWASVQGEKPRTWATLNAVMTLDLYRKA